MLSCAARKCMPGEIKKDERGPAREYYKPDCQPYFVRLRSRRAVTRRTALRRCRIDAAKRSFQNYVSVGFQSRKLLNLHNDPLRFLAVCHTIGKHTIFP